MFAESEGDEVSPKANLERKSRQSSRVQALIGGHLGLSQVGKTMSSVNVVNDLEESQVWSDIET
jgi:hypothetical protein